MFFIATYGHWIDDEQPAVGAVTADDLRDLTFFIEAKSYKEAERIAKQYESIETHAYEGLGNLKSLTEASVKPAHVSPITIYDDCLPKNIQKRNVELIRRLPTPKK